MATQATGAARYPVAYATAFDVAARILPSLGMPLSSADPSTGRMTARSSMGLLTWGENLTLAFRPIDEGSTEIAVTSALKFGLVDWGKNKANLAKVHGALAAACAAPLAPPAGAWHPDPTGRHELRWWDGVRWSDTVSDAGAPSTDPC